MATSAGIDADAVLEAISGLVEKSLVSLCQQAPPRFRLAEATRLHAIEHLSASGEAEAVQHQHVVFMNSFMRDAYRAWLATAEAPWRGLVEPELDSLRAALHRALVTGTDLATGAELAASALPLWLTGDAHRRAEGLGYVQRAIDLLVPALPRPLASADTLGVPLGNWVAVLFEQGQVDQGDAMLDEALALLRKAGKAWELCDALSVRLVLTGRPRDAAQVQGNVDGVHAAASEVRQPNEQRLHDQVLHRLGEALGEPERRRWHDFGARLTEDAALGLALRSPGGS